MIQNLSDGLLEGEKHFQLLADFVPQLMWLANPDGWIYWYNKRCYDYSGTTPEEIEGWGWQAVLDPEALPAVLEGWTRSIATGEPFETVFPIRAA
ncbi:MAG: PAS domain-containing protein, partial [Methylocella sp.]